MTFAAKTDGGDFAKRNLSQIYKKGNFRDAKVMVIMMNQFEVVLCILNAGFSDAAMDAARACGARGGTIMHGRGTASKDAEKLFNITIQPEKEIVMILVACEIKDAVLKGLYDAVGVNTDAQGIAFTLPVDDVVGIGGKSKKKKENKE